MKKYELIVIGSGPAGEKAAVKAAYFGHKVALIEKQPTLGGAEIITGTLPSKTLKESALYYSGKYEKGLYGQERELKHQATIDNFMFRKNIVTPFAAQEVKENLARHHVDLYQGSATFEDPHTIRIRGLKETIISGDYIIIATGSTPYHPPEIPFDGKRVHDSDTILDITRFPSSLCVIGAGVIGCEYATIFSTMGTKVFLVNDKEKILHRLDQEIAKELVTEMQSSGIQILFNTKIASVKTPKNDKDPIDVTLESGEVLHVDMLLYAAGRMGNVADLGLEKIGIQPGRKNIIEVDHTFRTNIPNIFAVGDVIGFPSLASTSMEQGRVAVAHIFHTQDLQHLPSSFPYGIYTIPEVSMVGLAEDDAIEQKIPYFVGKAYYKDMARGQIMGVKAGFLKLIFTLKDHKIIGVQIIGPLATEIVHYGVALVEDKKTIHDVIGAIFNFPTLHDLYKYAAYDGLSTLTGHRVKP